VLVAAPAPQSGRSDRKGGAPMKRHIKGVVRLIIESDGNLYTLIIRASKAQLIGLLDRLIPDDEETTTSK